MDSSTAEVERERLRDTDEYIILDYIRSSVEILMNLKIEEYEDEFDEKVKKRIKDMKINEKESFDETDDEAPNNYEKVI